MIEMIENNYGFREMLPLIKYFDIDIGHFNINIEIYNIFQSVLKYRYSIPALIMPLTILLPPGNL